MDNKSKQILLKLVQEIEDLRANIATVSAHETLKTSTAQAKDSKANALKSHEQHYKELCKEIEAL